MPRNYIFLGVEFLLAKCMTEASSEDYADQSLHFKCTSTHISHSWTLDTTYSLTQTLLPPPNPTLNSTSTTQNYRFAHCKTIDCRRPGRGCLKEKWCIPLDLLRLSWLVVALLLPILGLTWRTPSHDSRLSPWWKWILSCRREWWGLLSSVSSQEPPITYESLVNSSYYGKWMKAKLIEWTCNIKNTMYESVIIPQ
jgi:hypothetical protein